jgi:hypothetical protein
MEPCAQRIPRAPRAWRAVTPATSVTVCQRSNKLCRSIGSRIEIGEALKANQNWAGRLLNSNLLRRTGEGLYGPNWHSALAQDLRVNRRVLQRWAAGDAPLPRTLRRDLARLVAARQDMLGGLYRELSAG